MKMYERIEKVIDFAKREGLYIRSVNNVKMLYVKEIGEFIKKLESAGKSAEKSKLRFKEKNLISLFSD